MKIIIIGASGKIGTEIVKQLSRHHEIIRVGATRGDLLCDYTNEESVRSMFEAIGSFDALVSVAGNDSLFKPFDQLVDDDYRYGFERKFLSQVRLLTLGLNTINDSGSFTFSSGFLSHYPNPASIATGPLNAAIDAFVQNKAKLLPRNIRLNIVSPAPIVEPERAGRGLISAEECAGYYVNALEGNMSGAVLRAWAGLPYPLENS